MKKHRLSLAVIVGVAAAWAFQGAPAAAQKEKADTPAGIPVSLLVTAEGRHGSEPPDINGEDVLVRQGHDRAKVISWVPARGAHAGLELLLLLDDSSGLSLGSQIEELRAFINRQPPTTFIGVGYMRNGTVDMAQDFTQDRAAAGAALRLPMGRAADGSSPYFSIVDMIKHWPENPARPRREILMMSDGIDRYRGGAEGDNLYVDAAIQDSQRAGIAIFTIYTPGAARNMQGTNGGKSFLDQVSGETGGNPYYLGFGSAVSFAPFLDELTGRLGRQYLLTFLAKPEKKGDFQAVKVTTEDRNVKLVFADKVYVPGTGDAPR